MLNIYYINIQYYLFITFANHIKKNEIITTMLENLFQWYINNQAELVKKYNGKYLVIAENDKVDAFDSSYDALLFAEKEYGLGNFIIQECSPGDGSYTQTFHSRVVFC